VLRKVSGRGNSDGASFPRTTATSGAWAHTPPRGRIGKLWDREQLTFFFPSSSAVTCKTQKKNATEQLILAFYFFVFRFASLLLDSFHRRSFFGFCLPLLQFRWLAAPRMNGREGGVSLLDWLRAVDLAICC